MKRGAALNKAVRRVWGVLSMSEGCAGGDECNCRARRKVLREELRRVAQRCADLIDREPLPTTYAKSRRDAAATIREAFGVKG